MNLAVFDLDGTLINHFPEDDFSFVQAFFDAFNIRDLNQRWDEYEHHTDLFVVSRVFHAARARYPSLSELQSYISAYVQLLESAALEREGIINEIGGARSFLARLGQGNAWQVAIATGGWERSARFKLAAAGFDAGEIPSAFAESGPSREAIVTAAIERAREACGRSFEKTVLLGDGIWDVRTANSLGLPCIGIAEGAQADYLLEKGARSVLPDFRDQGLASACFEDY